MDGSRSLRVSRIGLFSSRRNLGDGFAGCHCARHLRFGFHRRDVLGVAVAGDLTWPSRKNVCRETCEESMNDSNRGLSAIDSLQTKLCRLLGLAALFAICSSLLVDRVAAQHARGAISIEFSDPLKKVGGMGTRSIDVTISMANPGAVATRDEIFYVVFNDHARSSPRSRKLTAVAQVVLPKGAATVSTELIAQKSLSNFYDYETVFVETDGDLDWRDGRRDLAATRSSRSYRNVTQVDDRIEFLFITDSPKIKNGSEKWIVDRSQPLGSPKFRYVDSNQTIAPAVTGVTTPPAALNTNVGGSGTAAKTLPAVVLLQELISQANYVDAPYIEVP